MLIHPKHIDIAEAKLQNFAMHEKESLLDEVYREQPHMLASVIVLQQFGVSLQKMDFALNILMLIYLSMRESGGTWPLITEDVQEANQERTSSLMRKSEGLDSDTLDTMIVRSAEQHSELVLYHAVAGRISSWLRGIEAEESDKYVMMSVWNMVECVACPTKSK